ncbi:MAG: GIY-YIG nuclease family protein [Sphingobacteriales bacterium]|nr:GIY-YIG nuclease family protein [Sphingobacteriales bacterium]MBI3719352.1 GIY-YIG nuclease family protein [Sphingobacteriales bacterium]
MNYGGYIYLITNVHNRVIYTGVTSNLVNRVWQHRNKQYPTGFTARYNVDKLVYYQFFETIEAAIAEEKRIKGGSRKQKIDLINSMNPEWKDLWDDIKN